MTDENMTNEQQEQNNTDNAPENAAVETEIGEKTDGTAEADADKDTTSDEKADAKDDATSDEKKDAKKPDKKKRTILLSIASVAVAAAIIVVCILACGGKKTTNGKNDDTTPDITAEDTTSPDGTDTAETGDAETALVTDDQGAPVTDGNGNTVTETAPPAVTNAPSGGNQGGTPATPSNGDDPVTPADTHQEVEIFQASEDPNKWPAGLIPSGIPACKYSSLDRGTKSEDGTQTAWFLSWTTTQGDYEKWLTELAKAGFRRSESLPGTYANGKNVLSIYTEDDSDGLWVSFDVFESQPIDYAGSSLNNVFPAFDQGDATLEYWADRPDLGRVTVQYACATDWDALVRSYKDKLANSGFSFASDEKNGKKTEYAHKTVDGKQYEVHFDGTLYRSNFEQLVFLIK